MEELARMEVVLAGKALLANSARRK